MRWQQTNAEAALHERCNHAKAVAIVYPFGLDISRLKPILHNDVGTCFRGECQDREFDQFRR